jgi:hypothetical protein
MLSGVGLDFGDLELDDGPVQVLLGLKVLVEPAR